MAFEPLRGVTGEAGRHVRVDREEEGGDEHVNGRGVLELVGGGRRVVHVHVVWPDGEPESESVAEQQEAVVWFEPQIGLHRMLKIGIELSHMGPRRHPQ